MPKQIVIAEQNRIAAVFSEDQIQELIVATGSHQVSDIYLGTVENVLPGIDAAFVNIGDSERNGFMHVTDLGPLKLKRSAGSITELVVPQQKVLVQIMKEPTGNKGPRLTGNISLPGRYLVLMPSGRGVNLSRRIRSESERNRLRALAILIKPAGMGLLVRTEAEGISENAIIEDLETLQKQWESIQQQALSTRPPALLNRDDDFIQRVLRDAYNAEVNRIVTDSSTGMKRVKQHLANWSDGQVPAGVLIDHHRERIPILEYFRVNAAIREALKPRVDLPSGGYIIIERTEALTVVDVNSGSFTRSATARETVLWTNCEAAAEIARQLRLRNIAGVIVVDFIDMDSRRDKLQVLEHFTKALRSDKARPQISQLSELGLVELTRKRQGQNIYELFGRPCPTCGGLGHLVHLPGEVPMDNGNEVAPRALTSGVSPAPQLAPLPPGDPSDFDSRPDLQELDLGNHPSYQDKSGRGNNRRRRRRDPLPTRSNGKELPVVKDSGPAPLDFKEPIESLTPLVSPKPEDEKAVPRGRGRTGGRTDSQSDPSRNRKSAVPPQVVTVEMTPDEQRIYAMMGISPMVLSTQEVADPRNVMVSVVLPGQAPPEIVSLTPMETSAETAVEVPLVGVTEPAPPAPKPSPSRTVRTRSARAQAQEAEVMPLDAIASTPEPTIEPAPVIQLNPVEVTPEAEPEESSSSVRRRRRRRSSSAGDGGDE
ncbi:Rne/Rng family ribonuclease [Phormidium tenue]|uniref:Ribonuclease E/G n=1 Tax=Phormidium tenue NIES-30 TaxID=549789 RepID=A0A1U7JBI9_9CYAN|nr:Rne/Rng family ribonuclease [Phormidium tenue]MBD2230056.1 Rne/Rng family ribonuclease [Phormidium tenue FACHB-1052]OKH51103.1 ribonuclease E/G [Phormidium tenue NIES-30]